MEVSKINTETMVKNMRSEGFESRAAYLELMQKRIDELEQRLAAAEAMNKKLAKFFVTAIQCSFDGCDYDGGGMQDDALELGLIVESEPPEGEEGPWYRIVDHVKKLIEGE